MVNYNFKVFSYYFLKIRYKYYIFIFVKVFKNMKNYMVQIKTKKITTKLAYNLPKYRIKMNNIKTVL